MSTRPANPAPATFNAELNLSKLDGLRRLRHIVRYSASERESRLAAASILRIKPEEDDFPVPPPDDSALPREQPSSPSAPTPPPPPPPPPSTPATLASLAGSAATIPAPTDSPPPSLAPPISTSTTQPRPRPTPGPELISLSTPTGDRLQRILNRFANCPDSPDPEPPNAPSSPLSSFELATLAAVFPAEDPAAFSQHRSPELWRIALIQTFRFGHAHRFLPPRNRAFLNALEALFNFESSLAPDSS